MASGTTNYVSGAAYWAHGGLRQMTLGNSMVEQSAYYSRLRMTSLVVTKSGLTRSL